MVPGGGQGLRHAGQAKEEYRGTCQERDSGFPHLGQRSVFGSAHWPILPLVTDPQALRGVWELGSPSSRLA